VQNVTPVTKKRLNVQNVTVNRIPHP